MFAKGWDGDEGHLEGIWRRGCGLFGGVCAYSPCKYRDLGVLTDEVWYRALHISLFVSAVLLGKQSQRRMADKYDVELWTEEGEGSFCVASGSSVSYQDTTVGSKTILDHKTGSESLNMATKVAGETSSSKTTFEAQSISVPTEAGAGVLIKHLWRYKIANNVGIVSNDWTEEEKHTLVGSVKTVNMKRDTGKRRLTLTDADYEEVWTRL